MTQVTIDLTTGWPEGDRMVPYAAIHLRAYADDLRRVHGQRSISARSVEFIADQIEGQLPKPKPEEPTGLFAVVEDRDGGRWVNWRDPNSSMEHTEPWVEHFGADRNLNYDDIDVVKVLSPGV
jgi:hypothetical protein